MDEHVQYLTFTSFFSWIILSQYSSISRRSPGHIRRGYTYGIQFHFIQINSSVFKPFPQPLSLFRAPKSIVFPANMLSYYLWLSGLNGLPRITTFLSYRFSPWCRISSRSGLRKALRSACGSLGPGMNRQVDLSVTYVDIGMRHDAYHPTVSAYYEFQEV
jgi:hypothetical protein